MGNVGTMLSLFQKARFALLVSFSAGFGAVVYAFPVDTSAVLARAKAVSGGLAWDEVRSSHTAGKIETGGLKGVTEEWNEVVRGRGYSRFSLGPMTGAEGWDGQAGWSQDSSGQSKRMQGGDEVEAAVNDAYRRSLAYWYTNRWPAVIESAGERPDGGRLFEVIRITPKGGRMFEFWIDSKTGLIDRTVEQAAVETRTTLFSDFRLVNGRKVPFRIRVTNGETRYDQLFRMDAIEFNVPLDAGKFVQPALPAPDFSFAGGRIWTVVPFELINNHIYVEVRLNGQGPCRVLCDTGGENVVSPKLAAVLGVKSEGELQGRGVGEKSEDIGLAKLRTLEVGDITVSNQVFTVFELAPLSNVEGIEVEGLIGYEVFKRFVVEVNYERSRLTLTLPSAFKYQGNGTVVPFRFNDRIPQVDGSIDGLPGTFDIDTGSRFSVSLLKDFSEKHDLRGKLDPRVEAVTGWGFGGSARGLVARARELRLGEVRVAGPVTEISLQQKGALVSPYAAGNIGGGVLQRYNLTFDYGSQRIYFETNARTAALDVYDRSGMWINRLGADLKVVDVTRGGPGERAGVKSGDLIVAIEGAPITDGALVRLRKRFRSDPAGTGIRLGLKTASESREVELVLGDLF